jgi:hypothetical protein
MKVFLDKLKRKSYNTGIFGNLPDFRREYLRNSREVLYLYSYRRGKLQNLSRSITRWLVQYSRAKGKCLLCSLLYRQSNGVKDLHLFLVSELYKHFVELLERGIRPSEFI